MNYTLYKNQNIAAYVPPEYRGNLIYRKKEDVLVPDIISLLRTTHSKETLYKAQAEIMRMIDKQIELVFRLLPVFGNESDQHLPPHLFDLYPLLKNDILYPVIKNKIQSMFTKPKNEATEFDQLLFNILSENGLELEDFERHIDFVDFLLEPLDAYESKLTWFKYRMTHFFNLLLSEKEVVLSDYHLDFIVFFLQSYYNVFGYYYRKKYYSECIKYEGLVPFIKDTDNAFNNLFNFLSRYYADDYTSDFLSMVIQLDCPKPIKDPSRYGSRYTYLPEINEWGMPPIFVKKEKINDTFVCTYEPEIIDISYLSYFVTNFFKISLKHYAFYERDSEYGRFFSGHSAYIYYDKSKSPIEHVSLFDPSQAYNINMNWNKERNDEAEKNNLAYRKKDPYLY